MIFVSGMPLLFRNAATEAALFLDNSRLFVLFPTASVCPFYPYNIIAVFQGFDIVDDIGFQLFFLHFIQFPFTGTKISGEFWKKGSLLLGF
jgi:hypothetical protein